MKTPAPASTEDAPHGRAVPSTGTVVVTRPDPRRFVRTVGTSTITVATGTTVAQALAELTASDGSGQTRTVVDASGAPKPDGALEDGDRLLVLAEDGRGTGGYTLAVHDPEAARRDGAYWNAPLYEEIDRIVNAHTPTFPARRFDVTAPAYQHLVREITETYAVGNQAGDPAVTDSPLVFATRRVWFHGDAVKAAIQDCHDAGGGTVVIPPGASPNEDGAYYTGAIALLSGVNLCVEAGAVVKFVRNRSNAFYPVVRTSYQGTDLYGFSPLIYALHQRDIAVTGGGTLDGQEDMWNWRPWKKGYWGEPGVEDADPNADYGQNGVLERMNALGTPVETRIFSDDGHLPETIPVVRDGRVRQVPPPPGARVLRSTFRPSFIQPNDCVNVLIEGLRIRNVPFWIVHPLNCANVLIRHLDIHSDKTRDFEQWWNNDDGLDPESCRDVVLEHNTVTVSDDGVAIKSGRDRDGRAHRAPSERIIVRHSTFHNDGGHSAAISMGSEMSGSIRDVFVHDCVFEGPGLAMALKIKTNAARGGVVENVHVRDCLLRQASFGLVEFEADYGVTPPSPEATVFNPTIRNVFLDRVDTAPTMTPGRTTFSFRSAASRSPVENVRYRDSTFHTASDLAAGFARNRNIKNLVVTGVTNVDPETGATTRYDTTPPRLRDRTEAVPDQAPGPAVHLVPVSAGQRDVVTPLPGGTFTVRGQVDLTDHPTFPDTGEVRVLVDRDPIPVPVRLDPDGTFHSDPITLHDDHLWYRDRHYVAINLATGIDIDTVVHQVTVARRDRL
ncbi:glycoside hydrolase family 28 protein [Streptomyces radicis]|uniref:Polygalacturonase n=1 Tax=Streptomyces radicis TaxID=1750517 RepID=A0A3A9WCB0_9ACTN|nr:glycosyl hydrolase family 28 protein [Streptomyces radicis]RKN07004.1 hypothetical protein D7319_20115 [Streptomyces radicis]RKN15856.1 hypothetical protein D7318_26680 [Streptomyces radicis]